MILSCTRSRDRGQGSRSGSSQSLAQEVTVFHLGSNPLVECRLFPNGQGVTRRIRPISDSGAKNGVANEISV